MGTVRVTLEQHGCWLLVWTPSERGAFERELARYVPEERRSWDAAMGAWRIHVAFTDFALALAQKHFPEGWPLDECGEDGAALAEAFAELHLASTAPTEVVDAACKALVSIYAAEGATAGPWVERVTAACAVIRRHHERRDREAVRTLASTPWSDDG